MNDNPFVDRPTFTLEEFITLHQRMNMAIKQYAQDETDESAETFLVYLLSVMDISEKTYVKEKDRLFEFVTRYTALQTLINHGELEDYLLTDPFNPAVMKVKKSVLDVARQCPIQEGGFDAAQFRAWVEALDNPGSDIDPT